MTKGAYYNEIEPYAAEWLRNLIAAGEIAPGDVDERSIADVTPSELQGYDQCHFFAGIGIWSLALRNAGWHDTRRVWTGSCPCQPFSNAGKSDGFDDERHLWPHWFHLIEECGPDVVMGEQVASKDGLAWLDLVSSDVEGAGNSIWAVDTCAAGFGAPHWRQRLYWMAYTDSAGLEGRGGTVSGEQRSNGQAIARGLPSGLGDTNGNRRKTWRETASPLGQRCTHDTTGRLPSATSLILPLKGFWRDADWLCGTDGRFWSVEPGTFPLADGHPTNMGQVSAYGNALCVAQAQGFIESIM